MIAEILCVGTELLMGQVLNTNARFLARRLSALGVSLYHQTVVGDNADRLEEALRQALGRADVVITTGGLGVIYGTVKNKTDRGVFRHDFLSWRRGFQPRYLPTRRDAASP